MFRVGTPNLFNMTSEPQVVTKDASLLFHNPKKAHRLQVEAWTDKPLTYSEDKLTLFLNVDNNSTKKIQYFKVKLKQVWSFPEEKEKITVWKLNFQNSSFPLTQGRWTGQIPIVIPNLELKPTVSNGSFISLRYFISVRLVVSRSSDVKVRIPITIAAFKPLSEPELNYEEDDFKEDEANKEPVQPVFFQWDQITDSINTPPLVPIKNPNLNYSKVDTIDFDISEFSIDLPIAKSNNPNSCLEEECRQLEVKAVGYMDIIEAVLELAIKGQYQIDIMAIPDNLNQISNSIKDLMQQIKVYSYGLSTLSSKPENLESWIKASKDILHLGGVCIETTKQLCAKLSNSQVQQEMFRKLKLLFNYLCQIISVTKEIILFNPFSSFRPKDYIEKLVEDSYIQFDSSVQDFISFIGFSILQVPQQPNNVQKVLENFQSLLLSFDSHRLSNVENKETSNSTQVWNNMKNYCGAFAASIHKLLLSLHPFQQNYVNHFCESLTRVMQKMIEQIPFLSSNAYGERIMFLLKEIIQMTIKMLGILHNTIGQGDLVQPPCLEGFFKLKEEIQLKLGRLIILCSIQESSNIPEEALLVNQELTQIIKVLSEALKFHSESLNPFLPQSSELDDSFVPVFSSTKLVLETILFREEDWQKTSPLSSKSLSSGLVNQSPRTELFMVLIKKLFSAIQELLPISMNQQETEVSFLVYLLNFMNACCIELHSLARSKGNMESKAHIDMNEAIFNLSLTTREVLTKLKKGKNQP